MGLLSVFKKKKPKTMDLPPPPLPAQQDLPALPEIEAPPNPEIEPAPIPEQTIQPSFEQAAPAFEELHQENQVEQLTPPAPLKQQPSRQVPLYTGEEQVMIEVPQENYETYDQPVADEELIEAAPPQEETLLPRRESIAPLFVSTNDYQAILNGITEIKNTLGDSENILAQLTNIKNQEEKVFSEWKTYMEDIERKISYVDTVIANSQELHG